MKKRIALGVVAALAGGLLAAAPASAADSTLFALKTAESVANKVAVAGIGNYIEIQAETDTVGANALVAVSGAGATIDTYTASTGGDAWAIASDKLSILASGTNIDSSTAAGDGAVIRILTPTAGTLTISVSTVKNNNNGTFTTTAEGTIVVTVNAAATAGVLAVAKSTLYGVETATTGQANTDTTTATSTTDAALAATSVKGAGNAGTQVAAFRLALKDANSTEMPSTTDYSVTLSGPGVISTGTYANGGRVLAVDNTPTDWVYLFADGTSGKATLTFSVGTTVIGTKTVVFYGKVASLSATVLHKYVNTTTQAGAAVQVVAKDTDGNVVHEAPLTVTSSDTTKIATFSGAKSATAAQIEDGEASALTVGTVVATTAGAVTLTFTSTDVDTVKTTAVVNVAGVKASSVKLAFDKASYAPGEQAKVTVTLADAAGLPVADASYTDVLSSALKFSQALQGYTETTTITTVDGVATIKVYMPLAAGTVTASSATGTSATYLATAAQGLTLTASATVAVPASAAETANAAAIATLNTAVATLQTTVASLVASMTAQIKVINAALVKIAKKLKVKI